MTFVAFSIIQKEGLTLFDIIPLQQACGFEYTSKLQRMFQDVGVSKDLNEHFKRHLTSSGDPLDSKCLPLLLRDTRILMICVRK